MMEQREIFRSSVLEWFRNLLTSGRVGHCTSIGAETQVDVFVGTF